MIETFVDYALGPHGRFLSELYMEHQFPINTVVVGIAIYNLFFTKRKQSSSVKTRAESK
jgi:hypothetical protein